MFRKKFPLNDAAQDAEQITAGGVGGNETTPPTETQTATANIGSGDSTLANANTPDASTLANTNTATPPKWEGDSRYFQSGEKAGQLKPRYRAIGGASEKVSGLDAEKKNGVSVGAPTLNITDLQSSSKKAAEKVQEKAAEKVKLSKAEKKEGEARVAAKLVMRALDVIVNYISGGTFGKDFSAEQREQRNAYHEELEENWREYLLTLDIPMHPGLVCVVSSVMFIAPAFDTVKGQEKAKSLKEKVLGKIFSKLF